MKAAERNCYTSTVCHKKSTRCHVFRKREISHRRFLWWRFVNVKTLFESRAKYAHKSQLLKMFFVFNCRGDSFFLLLIMKPFYPGSFGFGISQQAIAEALVINRGGFECLVSRFSTWRIRGHLFSAPLRPFMKHHVSRWIKHQDAQNPRTYIQNIFFDKGNCERHEGENQYSTGWTGNIKPALRGEQNLAMGHASSMEYRALGCCSKQCGGCRALKTWRLDQKYDIKKVTPLKTNRQIFVKFMVASDASFPFNESPVEDSGHVRFQGG